MLEADRALLSTLQGIGANYRRYSDDILIICPAGSAKAAEQTVEAELKKVGLSVQPTKTVRVGFRVSGGRTECYGLDQNGQVTQALRSLQYLGLTWDGRCTRLRSATIAKFLTKMVRAIRAAARAGVARGETRLRRRKIYRRFSHLGRAARVFGPQPPKGRRNRNFTHYGALAQNLSQSLEIRRQLGRQWIRLEREIRRAEMQMVLASLAPPSGALAALRRLQKPRK
jgi:hypothetical protein